MKELREKSRKRKKLLAQTVFLSFSSHLIYISFSHNYFSLELRLTNSNMLWVLLKSLLVINLAMTRRMMPEVFLKSVQPKMFFTEIPPNFSRGLKAVIRTTIIVNILLIQDNVLKISYVTSVCKIVLKNIQNFGS